MDFVVNLFHIFPFFSFLTEDDVELRETYNQGPLILSQPVDFHVDLVHDLRPSATASLPLGGILEGGEIGSFPIDEDLLAMTIIRLEEIGLGTDGLQHQVRIIHSAVDTVGVFGTAEEIVLNTLRTGRLGAERTGDLATEDGGVGVGADGADVGGLFGLLRLLFTLGLRALTLTLKGRFTSLVGGVVGVGGLGVSRLGGHGGGLWGWWDVWFRLGGSILFGWGRGGARLRLRERVPLGVQIIYKQKRNELGLFCTRMINKN